MIFEQMKKDAALVNAAIEKLYSDNTDRELDKIIESEKYSLCAGGKRIRPIILLAFCRLYGGNEEAALPYALAIEMIHTASLIHDDLPSIDNDELRRGRPTNHTVYGEAVALLAGDGLLMDSFGIVAGNEKLSPKTNAEAVKYLSAMVGTHGLVGGEFIDVDGEERSLSLPELLKMDKYKTAALIKASAVLGALAAGLSLSDERIRDVELYAENIGIAFQVVDDILDVTGSAESLGKNPGQDEKENKSTYLSYYSLEDAGKYAESLTENALSAIEKYEGSEFLSALAKYLSKREN